MKRIQRSRKNLDNIVLTAEEEVRKNRCDNYLYDFSKAMKAKLEERAAKHPKDDVTKDTCPWLFKRSDLEAQHPRKHLAIVEGRIVGIGDTALEAYRKATKKHPNIRPLLTYLDSSDVTF